VLIFDPNLTGFEYGMQRDFEQTIREETDGLDYALPSKKLFNRFGPGMRGWNLRKFIPKETCNLPDHQLWIPLMGPELFPFWRRKNWDNGKKKIVVYLFDTLNHQGQYIKEMVAEGKIDYLVTSFPNSVNWLETITKRKWHSVPQGINTSRFYPLKDSENPQIAFSSYGRRLPEFHKVLKLFCEKNKQHYDFTVTQGLIPGSDPCDNYGIYAWHLRQSWFTVCWPVELTNPQRAPTFSPMTCRWFEAAASGSIIIGQPPKDPAFEEFFGKDFVEKIDPNSSQKDQETRLNQLWEKREELRSIKKKVLQERISQWTWSNRVQQIKSIVGTN
jgi:hypothetical protein